MKQRKISIVKLMFILFFSVFVIYAVLVYISLRISNISDRLAENSRISVSCNQIATIFKNGSENLSFSSRLFVSTGDCAYLYSYVKELEHDKNVYKAYDMAIDTFGESECTRCIENSIKETEELAEKEIYAMRLVINALGINESVIPKRIGQCKLSECDLRLIDNKALDMARLMVLDSDYQDCKNTIISDVENALANEQNAVSDSYNVLSDKLDAYMFFQKIGTTVLLMLLIAESITIIKGFINPLKRANDKIKNGNQLTENSKFEELNVVVDSYNMLIENKAKLEDDLLNLAKTDVLTLMPNRFAMNQYMVEHIINCPQKSVGVINFDVNDLKKINDSKGHAEGDELLRNAADCILQCFGDDTRKNCFRIGGDEFVTLLVGVPDGEIRKMIKDFVDVQKKYNISIAYGYVFSENTIEKSIDTIINEADTEMYKEKCNMKIN